MTGDVFDVIALTAGAVTDRLLITERRGVQVWRVTAAGSDAVSVGQRLAVKVVVPCPGYPSAGQLPAREYAVMNALREHFGGGWKPAWAGIAATGPFTVAPWYDGPSTWDLWQPVRDGTYHDAERRAAVRAAVELCETVAALHEAGWVHGDLQAAHCIHTGNGPRLIDLCNAHGPGLPDDDRREGAALIHLEAPELARALVQGRAVPVTTAASDVYAIAGSLWACASGEWPLAYDAHGLDEDEATTWQLRAAIGSGRVPLRLYPRLWPDLRGVLVAALAADPDRRPSADRLGRQLACLTG
ncbi:hypothetical protein P3T36_005089 [Kitasatospora sp. MAP12-15]|uniref:hypothetical protein n=1 Tax=unclassified Kitasatospora TaxID=2633591 RepID=UPI0024758E34|nr:hypothetical protein [Kitasatospora sp. MAP12-44]MDH6109919.1 hypothetical protein [Kitasatospora sp. MAP12-44]